ncbi:MAG: diguanylate cyclase [Desulfovermiculus sp.]
MKKIQRNITIISVLWIVLVSISFVWNYTNTKKEHTEIALQSAKSFFDLIVMTREWNARHGGVYVPVTPETQPNPYLDTPMRDIQVNEQLILTKVNPAFMTRQVSEISEKEGISFHITSLNPIRPQNKPRPIEKEALKAFEKGEVEKGRFIKQNGRNDFFYMAPLKTKKACLKCHAEQGYQEGDIRGGISVTLPFRESIPMTAMLLGHTGIGLVGLLGIFVAGRRLNNAYDTIRRQATYCELTGIPNRRSFSERIIAELNRSQRDQEPLSLIICDIDNFKSYNDHYGHEQGDRCLRKVAQQIQNTLKRPSDFCARFGGEEFAVLLPGTSLENAMHVAEEIRKNIEELAICCESLRDSEIVTISLGVATCEGDETCSRETLIYQADTAMYQAKKNGRNRVSSFKE